MALLATGFVQQGAGDAGAAAVASAFHMRRAAPVVIEGDPETPITPLGERFDHDASLAPHAERVHRTKIAARLDALSHTVHGEEEIRWVNRSRVAADELFFHLYLNAFKNNRTLYLREHLGEGRGARAPADWGYIDLTRLRVRRAREAPEEGVDLLAALDRRAAGDAEDETDARLPLPWSCAPGEELIIEIGFDSKLPSIVERTGYLGSFHMVAQWYPKLARRTPAGEWRHFPFHRLSEFDADFGDHEVTIDVPEGFVVGATGSEVERRVVGGRTITRHVQGDVHDFAWTAWDQFEERRETIGGVEVRALFPRGYEEVAGRELSTVRQGIGCLGRRFGKYPYPVLTIVHPPDEADEAGGMEYPTLITTGGPWYGPPRVRFPETLAIHEFGHQYFYGLVATDEHRYPFLDEGINSYAEGACLGEEFGPGSAASVGGLVVAIEALHREGALSAGHDDEVGRGAAEFATARQYARLVYSRTASLLRTLGGAFGRDKVDLALGRYARAYRYQHPDPRHLIAAFRDVGGEAMAEALRVGLFERGWVDMAVVEVASLKQASGSGVFDQLAGRQTLASTADGTRHAGWVVVVRRGTLKLPVELRLLFEDGSERRERWDGQSEWVKIEVSGPSPLVAAEVDPDGLLELDEQLANNGRSRFPVGLAPRVAERGAYGAALGAFAVAP
jgi:hypothetical protein